MGAKTDIEWCDSTWNPLSGCTPISAGCRNCYAKDIARRFAGQAGFPNGFDVTFFPDRLDIPAKWKKPRKIFVCSTGDLFHKDVNTDWLMQIFEAIWGSDQHTYFILTKRPERLKSFIELYSLSSRKLLFDNVWFGTSVEDNSTLSRMETVASIEGINRFVSFEPLLERLNKRKVVVQIHRIHWMICGGETGSKARPMPFFAVHDLLEIAGMFQVPFFFKKWGKGREEAMLLPRQFPDFRKEGE